MIAIFFKSLIIGFSIAMPVGPIGMLCIKNTLTNGFKIGLAVGFGAALADCFYGFLAGGGLSFISHFLINYTKHIKLIGAILLIYLGLNELKNAKQTTSKAIKIKSISVLQAIGKTFFLVLTNPATILSFIGIFASISPGALTKKEVAIMMFGVFIGSLIWWIILSGTVCALRLKISQKIITATKIICAAVLISFGIITII
jgi:threonine/homoserine/homoserine lactone efflux protein